MEKLQKKFKSVTETDDFITREVDPDKNIAVIESKGYFYVEDSPAFVRMHEQLKFEGKARDYGF